MSGIQEYRRQAMKIIPCKICDEEWGVSKKVKDNKYVCPHCRWKIEHKELIRLGGSNVHR